MTRRDGYTPCSWSELDSDISSDALRLLLHIRRTSDRDETDGFVSDRELKALAVLHRIRPSRLRKALSELLQSSRLLSETGGVRDANFKTLCRTADERERRREQWKQAARIQRGPKSSDDARADSADESTPSPSSSASTSLAASAA